MSKKIMFLILCSLSFYTHAGLFDAFKSKPKKQETTTNTATKETKPVEKDPADLEAHIRTLQKNLKDVYAQTQNEKRKQAEENEKLRQEKVRLFKVIRSMEEAADLNKEEAEELNKKLQQANTSRTKGDELTLSAVEKMDSNRGNNDTELELKLEETERQLERAQKQIDSYKRELDQRNDQPEASEELLIQNEALKQEIRKQQKEISEIKKTSKNTGNTEASNEKIEALSKENAIVIAEKEALERKVEEYSQGYSSLKRDAEKLSQENKKMEEIFKDQENRARNLASQNEVLEKRLEAMTKKHDALARETSENKGLEERFEKDRKGFEEVIENYQEKTRILESKITGYEKTIEAYEKKLAQKDSENRQLTTDLNELQAYLDQRTSGNSLERENEDLKTTNNRMWEALNKLQSENEALKAQIK